MRPPDRDVAADRAPHEMRDCPRYDSCSVPICPLDEGWHQRSVMPGEGVCPYLREFGKPGDAVARFAGRYDVFVIEAARVLFDELRRHPHPRYVYIAQQIEASAATPTMIEQEAARSERGRKLAADRNRKRGQYDMDLSSDDLETDAAGSPRGSHACRRAWHRGSRWHR